MTRIGFTGTRFGATLEQKNSLRGLLASETSFVAHHGDCVGADADFHALCLEHGGGQVVVHPPVNETDRAFCAGYDVMRAPYPYMKRNKNIVDACDVLIAVPFGFMELEYGGTWRTVGLARKAKKPILIVWPDGRIRRGDS